METITAAVARQVRDRPRSIALIDGTTRLSWAEVETWMDRAAGWLLGLGLPRGSTVLGWLPNCAEWYLVRLACEQAGLFWIPVPASQGTRELASIMERVRPEVLITKPRFRDRDYVAEVDEILPRIGLAPLRVTLPESGLLSLDGPPADGRQAMRLDELVHALPTTGSEGTPKIALYTLGAACERAHAQSELLGLTPEDVLLVLSPGAGPARAAWLASPVAGSCVVAMPVFGIGAALKLVERERVTVVCGTPAQLAMLAAKLEHHDTSSVRIWYTAGSILPPSLAEELEANTRGIVVSTYGGADFGGWAAPDPGDPPAVRHHTVGRARGKTEFRIVDDNGRAVPQGEVGELIGRGPCCTCGFIGEHGSDKWRDGWFHTGDLAWLNAEGNCVIVGRLKDLIIRGGDKVSPAEVEALLRTHPDVAQVAVIGAPDPVLGETVCACIVPRTKDRPLELEALRRHLRELGLAPYKAPEGMLVLDSLPVIGDKIDRRALAAMLVEPATT
jgi:acyl-CoA synthetase (AMP-forming)/AMP-acid ligase II